MRSNFSASCAGNPPSAALAHAFASLGGAPPALLDALAARAAALEGQLDVAVRGCLRASSPAPPGSPCPHRLQARSCALHSAVCRDFDLQGPSCRTHARSPPSPPARRQAVANLAWAYSTLQHDHPQLFECLAREALRLLRQQGEQEEREEEQGPAGGAGVGTAVISSSRGSSSGGGGGGGIGGVDGRQGFNAQAVSVVAFSFAAANRCDSPAQREVSAVAAPWAEL